MKKLFYLLLITTSVNLCSQSSDLKGYWILERTVYENGNFLEINNPLYSSFTSLEFNKNSVKINGKHFESIYYPDSMKVGFRNIDYKFQDGYLIIQDKHENKISVFSKYEDYIKKHPEFLSETKVIDNDTILLANDVIAPSFNQKVTFEDFLRKNIGEYTKQQIKNVLFKANFVFTKNHKIRNINITQGISKKFDKQFIDALQKAENYLMNKTDYDIIIEHKFNFVKMHNYYDSENAKIFHEIDRKAGEYYELNQFEKVITEYSKFNLDLLANQKDRFQHEIWEAYLKLGISYLALNRKEKACNAFDKIGKKTNFFVRNYLTDFCEN